MSFEQYGNVIFHHDTSPAAEREAQEWFLGVWDQIVVNGSEVRNYAALGTWWHLGASIFLIENVGQCPPNSR
jgi:micrococcal nuclease